VAPTRTHNDETPISKTTRYKRKKLEKTTRWGTLEGALALYGATWKMVIDDNLSQS